MDPRLNRRIRAKRNANDSLLKLIDSCFERFAECASVFKVGDAYARSLKWDEVSKSDTDEYFNQFLSSPERPGRDIEQQFENFNLLEKRKSLEITGA